MPDGRCPGAKEVRVLGISLWQNAEAAECAREDKEDRQGQRQGNHNERVDTRQEEHTERVDTRQEEKSERTHDRAKYGYNPVGDAIDSGLGGLAAITGGLGSGIGEGFVPVAVVLGGSAVLYFALTRKG